MRHALSNKTGAAVKFNIALALACICLSWGVMAQANSDDACNATAQAADQSTAIVPLPQRTGLRVQTSGKVPHVQLGMKIIPELVSELHRLAYQLPGLEERPTIVSLPGAAGMWLSDSVPVAQPKAIVSGREFSHIHKDGSLHAPLPFKRALELEQKGWGERHPWADRFEGWEGLVMLYSATDTDQLKILIQLVTESYNYVTGQTVSTPVC